MTFTVEHSDASQPVVFILSGNVLGGPEAMAFSEAVSERVRHGATSAIVDLSDVDVMNSSGLGMLVAASRSFRAVGGGLAVAGASDKVRNLFSMTRLDTVFAIHANREEAMAAVGRS